MKHDQPPVPFGGTHIPMRSGMDIQHYYHPTPVHVGYASPYQDDAGFDIGKLFWVIFRYRWVIASLLVLGVVLAVLFTWVQTPLYRASAQIEVISNQPKILEDFEILGGGSNARDAETVRLKLLSRDLARRVVYEMNLTENPDFLFSKSSFSLGNVFRRAFGVNEAKSSIDELTPEQREFIAVNRIVQGLTTSNIRFTSLINIGFSHSDPEFAAAIPNQIAKSFLDQSIDSRSESSELARQFIEEQVRDTKKRLEESEKALVDYARKEGITITGSDASLISENITQMNASLARAIDEQLLAERHYTQVREGNVSALPQVYESASIREAKSRITELRGTYQEKLATLKPGFPEMRRLSAQIAELERQQADEVNAIARSVEIQYEQSLEKVERFRQELAKLEAEQASYQEKNIEYTILKREVDSNRTQYQSLIGKLNEVGVGSEIKTASASVVQQALVPSNSYHPRMSINLVIATLFSGLMAGGIIFVLELLNNTFTVPDQVERDLNIPVLGILPSTKESEIKAALDDPSSGLSEAYRTLRTSLQFSGTEGGNITSLMVTSSEPSEGKSSTILKLAQEFSALGRTVLVIDADLRKPRAHRMFNLDNGIGLSNLLTNVVNSSNVGGMFRQIPGTNITLLSAGTIPPNPSDLLASEKMGLTIHLCKKKYDMVLVDSPPVMGLADAPIISRNVDGVLMVISCKQVPRSAAKQALKRLQAAGANVLGAAVTKFAVDKLDYNYAYRYMNKGYYEYGVDTDRKQIGHSGDEKKSWSFGSVSNWAGRFARNFDQRD